jgi:hypothetical protein
MNPLMLWTCSILVNYALLECKWKVGHIWIFLIFFHNFKMPTCLRKFNDHDGLQNICMFQIADIESFLNKYKRVHNEKRKEKGLTCELLFFFFFFSFNFVMLLKWP